MILTHDETVNTRAVAMNTRIVSIGSSCFSFFMVLNNDAKSSCYAADQL